MKVNQQGKPKYYRFLQAGLGLAAVFLLASCAAPTMRNQFRNYNEAYADSLNQQMLLNLARLQNGHPAYYLAIGLIDNRYTFSSQTSAGATGSYTDAKTTTQNTPTSATGLASFPARVVSTVLTSIFGGSLGEQATVTSNPEFQFIPINNEIAARQVLEPIATDVFLQLYQQGYPIDQLLRIMIERIETPRLPDGEHLVLVNSPTCGTPFYYERFLRACAILRTLQMHGCLSLEAGNKTERVGTVSFGKSGSPAPGGVGSGGVGSGGKGGAGAEAASADPAPKDFFDAEDKGMVLTNTDRGWQLYRRRAVPDFFLKGVQEAAGTNLAFLTGLLVSGVPFDPAQLSEEKRVDLAGLVNLITRSMDLVKTNQTVPGLNDYKADDFQAITNVIMALSGGISIQTDVGTDDNASTRLVLRSFNRTMEAVATEQSGFAALPAVDPQFARVVPAIEQRPILQLIWTNKTALLPPLETIDYAKKTYQITDPVLGPLDPAASWNRDVFRLIVDLSSQVTVDISKFQRQVLELNQ
jgi:hypothetical protein